MSPTVLQRQSSVRALGPEDFATALAVAERDPVLNVFLDFRIRSTGLQRRLRGGEIWGFFYGDELVSLCHVGANLVMDNANEDAARAFARAVKQRHPSFATVVGPQAVVEVFWNELEFEWATPLEYRWEQPHLELKTSSHVQADPKVVRTLRDQFDVLYPACVAMYREEVGSSPESEGGSSMYRARVAALIDRGWSFSRIEDGELLFKAEVACASPFAAQIQGVYVPPEYRNKGLATAGVAAVANAIQRDIAPVASLYHNSYNVAAGRAYARIGFAQTATLSTLML